MTPSQHNQVEELNHQQILEKAINKSIEGGWKTDIFWDDMYGQPTAPDGDGGYYAVSAYTIIFNHEFCKALWGGLPYNGPKIEHRPLGTAISLGNQLALWQYHLQSMVLSTDPIAYIGEHI